jgi:SH3 domain-containing protein
MLDKCIHALCDRPATCAAVIASLLLAPVMHAQSSVRSVAPLLAAPAGRELATLRPGAVVRTATVRQGHTQVTLDGFVDGSLLGAGRDSFPTVVKAPGGARLRSAGRLDASIVADLRDGMGVTVISRTGDWVRVRRTAWVASTALGASSPSVPAAGSVTPSQTTSPPRRPAGDSAGESKAASPAAPAPPPGALTPTGSTELRTGANGRAIGRLDSGAHLTVLARDAGWTRVRVEGWVRDQDIVPADTALRLSLSAADIRAAPDQARGAIVRWNVQFIAVQRADQLRRDLRVGEPYILARGPGDESGLLYFAIPPSLVAEVERFEPLQSLTVTAKVRVGRSEPVGIPVLDLLSATRR